MDPDEHLREAVRDVLNGKYTEAFQRIEDYETWLGKAGFAADAKFTGCLALAKEFQEAVNAALKDAHESAEKRTATISVSKAISIAESSGMSRGDAVEYMQRLVGAEGLSRSSELSIGELLHVWQESEWTERVWLFTLLSSAP